MSVSLYSVLHGGRTLLRCAAAAPLRGALYSTQKAPLKRRVLHMSVVGLTGVLGLGYIGYDLTKEGRGEVSPHIEHKDPLLLESLPPHTPTRRVNMSGQATDLELTLFQYQTCPFCCKVRAFLDAHGIAYNVVEVDAVMRQAIRWSSYKKVPILLVKTEDGYRQLNDSTAIISIMSSYLLDKSRDISEVIDYYPNVTYNDDGGKPKDEILNKYFLMFNQIKRERTLEQINDERKWRKWADDVLVHTLSPNVYRTKGEAFQAFNWFCDIGEWKSHFPAWECSLMVYAGAYAMYFISKRLKKRHNLKDDVRQSLYDECNIWLKEVKGKGGPFMGGATPNLADVSVYGVLCSIEGCDAFQDLLANTKINSWYSGMKDHVLNKKGLVLL